MPTSPVTLTIASTGGASVDLGGFYRRVQVGVFSTPMSSSPEGAVWATHGPLPLANGTEIMHIDHPFFSGGENYSMSPVETGFIRFVNCFTASMSSAFWSGFAFQIYFDGPQD